MQPLKLSIEGRFFDSHIYRDRLYLFGLDGTVSTYNWRQILESWDVPAEAKLPLTCAFFQSDYLYGHDFTLLFSDPDVKALLLEKFDALSRTSIVVTADHLRHAMIDTQTSPFPFPHAGIEVYNRIGYGVGSDGLYKASTGPGLRHPFSTRVERLSDIPAVAITASWGALALSCANEGLWQLPIYDYNRELKRVSEVPCVANDWNFQSIFASSYDVGGYLASYRLEAQSESESYRRRVFDEIIPSSKILTSETEFAFGFKDKICGISGKSLVISRYNPWNEEEPRFQVLDHILVDGDYGRVVSGALASFGLALEFERALLILLSSGDRITVPGEPVNWKVFPRSRFYENQLHVVYEDRFEILSFNHDYFVDQGSKTIGSAVQSRLVA